MMILSGGWIEESVARRLKEEPTIRFWQEEQVKTIEFYAEVAKVQTTVDGVRVILDLGEDGRKVMEALTECKQNGVVLDIVATPNESK